MPSRAHPNPLKNLPTGSADAQPHGPTCVGRGAGGSLGRLRRWPVRCLVQSETCPSVGTQTNATRSLPPHHTPCLHLSSPGSSSVTWESSLWQAELRSHPLSVWEAAGVKVERHLRRSMGEKWADEDEEGGETRRPPGGEALGKGCRCL